MAIVQGSVRKECPRRETFQSKQASPETTVEEEMQRAELEAFDQAKSDIAGLSFPSFRLHA